MHAHDLSVAIGLLHKLSPHAYSFSMAMDGYNACLTCYSQGCKAWLGVMQLGGARRPSVGGLMNQPCQSNNMTGTSDGDSNNVTATADCDRNNVTVCGKLSEAVLQRSRAVGPTFASCMHFPGACTHESLWQTPALKPVTAIRKLRGRDAEGMWPTAAVRSHLCTPQCDCSLVP